MDLPLLPPVKPMLAKAATKLPTGDDLYYEPKWDGFRPEDSYGTCLVEELRVQLPAATQDLDGR